ncbi:CIA30 family protein [Alteromonas sp. KUL49]|uniref:CIA30 family protein n=1 Tax=Alteromonas sp. KUL49 TaxID=2480798 RepID=UPI00102EF80F|nr:CIA30 family protein [Alteromonas sp. KUL49]TAP42445.1 CIA30 family protein [Alteromonas sp. KUL49]GEA10067.1 exonuclease [Alteromonas sp. KUL49]
MKKLLFALALVLTHTPSKSSEYFLLSLANDTQCWRIANDTVMGGVSQSDAILENNAMHFFGTMRLENNGGFVSISRCSQILGLTNKRPLQIRIKGDGKTYQLRLKTNKANGIAYSAKFTTNNTWQTIDFAPTDFEPVFRGRAVVGAPPLKYEDVNSVGFLLSDKQAGSFSLMVDVISQ